jgi:hypothetical protein
MATRPIVLLGSEQAHPASSAQDNTRFCFDPSIGVWRASDGRLAILVGGGPGTRITATREGTDETEVSTPTTRITETREGIDQVEVTEAT